MSSTLYVAEKLGDKKLPRLLSYVCKSSSLSRSAAATSALRLKLLFSIDFLTSPLRSILMFKWNNVNLTMKIRYHL